MEVPQGVLHELWQKSPPKRSPENRRFGLVSWVDWLGFSQFAWKVPSNELEKMLRYAGNYTRSASTHFGMGTPPREFVKFQDSLVRCTEIGWADDEEADTLDHIQKWYLAISDEVASLRDIQLNFAGEGILLRGAVTLGLYDLAEDVVHGPAVNRAIDAESSYAKFPRIVLESTILEFLSMAPAHTHWFDLNVRTAEDGLPFIDYLRGAAFEAPWDLTWYAEALEKHKFSLDRLTAKRPGDERVEAKLRWLVDYHNHTIEQLASSAPRSWELDWPTFGCAPSWM